MIHQTILMHGTPFLPLRYPVDICHLFSALKTSLNKTKGAAGMYNIHYFRYKSSWNKNVF